MNDRHDCQQRYCCILDGIRYCTNHCISYKCYCIRWIIRNRIWTTEGEQCRFNIQEACCSITVNTGVFQGRNSYRITRICSTHGALLTVSVWFVTNAMNQRGIKWTCLWYQYHTYLQAFEMATPRGRLTYLSSTAIQNSSRVEMRSSDKSPAWKEIPIWCQEYQLRLAQGIEEIQLIREAG